MDRVKETFNQYVQIFLDYLKFIEKLEDLDVEDVTSLTTYEKSVIATNHTKYQTLMDKYAIPPYNTEEAKVFLNSIVNTFSAIRSIIETRQVSNDPLVLDDNVIDNLLLSFGFDYLGLSLISKRKLLSILISAYKHKGTISSIQKVLSSITTDIDIKELWLQKYVTIDNDNNITVDKIVFEWQINDITFPGGKLSYIRELDYNSVIDKHWWIPIDRVLNAEVTRWMSPFFIASKQVDTSKLSTAIALLKYKAYKDYEVLLTDRYAYNDRKTVISDSLPQPFTILELWLMIRYFWMKIKHYNLMDDNQRNWFHINYDSITYDELKDIYTRQFEIRYSKDFDSIHANHSFSDLDIKYFHAMITKINDSEYYRYTETNRTLSTIIPYQNKIAIIFGYTSGEKDRRITILSADRPNNTVTNITLDFWLRDFIAYSFGDYIVLTGGYDEYGNKNTNTYIIDVKDRVYHVVNEGKVYDDIHYPYYVVYDYKNSYNYITYVDDNNRLVILQITKVNDTPRVIYISDETNIDFIECIAINENSELLITYSDTDYYRKYLIFDTKQSTYKIITRDDYPEYPVALFSVIIPIYIMSFGSGFSILMFTDTEVYQFFLHPTSFNNVSSYIIHKYKQYPTDKNNAYKINPSDYSLDMLRSYVVSPHGSILYNMYQVDILYHLKELAIDSLMYTNHIVSDIICNDENARCFRESMIKQRYNELVLDNEVLPTFDSLDDLEDLLNDLTPENIAEFNNSTNKVGILYDLLTIAGQLTNSDLTGLLPDYYMTIANELINRFKPIHSRLVNIYNRVILADPIGDWIALADELLVRHVLKFDDYLTLRDHLSINVTKTIKEFLSLHDDLTIKSIIAFKLGFTKQNAYGYIANDGINTDYSATLGFRFNNIQQIFDYTELTISI